MCTQNETDITDTNGQLLKARKKFINTLLSEYYHQALGKGILLVNVQIILT